MEERREQKTIEGFGRIFKPRYTRKSADGSRQVYQNPIWWIAYYDHGEELRESSDSREEKEAIKLLKRRVQDLGRGIVGTKEERVNFEEMVEDLKNDYKVNGKRSLDSVELSIRHLSEFFAGDKARHITTDRVRQYIAKRQGEGAANASINKAIRIEALLLACHTSREAVSSSLHSNAGRKQRPPGVPRSRRLSRVEKRASRLPQGSSGVFIPVRLAIRRNEVAGVAGRRRRRDPSPR
jgi:hypothetical protein